MGFVYNQAIDASVVCVINKLSRVVDPKKNSCCNDGVELCNIWVGCRQRMPTCGIPCQNCASVVLSWCNVWERDVCCERLESFFRFPSLNFPSLVQYLIHDPTNILTFLLLFSPLLLWENYPNFQPIIVVVLYFTKKNIIFLYDS